MDHDKNLVDAICRVVHEVNREICIAQGDYTQQSWEAAPQWQRESARKGVLLHLNNPGATPKDSHDSWLKEKTETGWKYGAVKDVEKREHPCMVPYDELPFEQRIKDVVFRGIVRAIAHEQTRN